MAEDGFISKKKSKVYHVSKRFYGEYNNHASLCGSVVYSEAFSHSDVEKTENPPPRKRMCKSCEKRVLDLEDPVIPKEGEESVEPVGYLHISGSEVYHLAFQHPRSDGKFWWEGMYDSWCGNYGWSEDVLDSMPVGYRMCAKCFTSAMALAKRGITVFLDKESHILLEIKDEARYLDVLENTDLPRYDPDKQSHGKMKSEIFRKRTFHEFQEKRKKDSEW